MMNVNFDLVFSCPENIRPYLQKVFAGEYDIPVFMYAPKILDLGANCGAFSIWASHRFPGCTIDAYEPHPETFKILQANTKKYPNITCHNVGVGSPGLRPLFDGVSNCGESSFHDIQNNPTPVGRHVEVIDPLTLPGADMIKLDIEGCELEVLRPLIEAQREFSLIMFEWHNHQIRKDLEALLEDYFLIGANVENMWGRGVNKYAHKSILPGVPK